MHSTEPTIDHHLLYRIAEGHEPSFRQLYDAYFHTIYSTALAFTQSHQVAMEVVQETFLRVWKQRTRLPEMDNPAGFIYVIGRNQIKTAMKSGSSFSPAEILINTPADPDTGSPERSAIIKQFREELHKAINLLPAQQAAVFKLSRFDQLSYEEISRQLNISTSTVRNHLVKALGFMRTYFSSRHKDLFLFLLLMIEKNI